MARKRRKQKITRIRLILAFLIGTALVLAVLIGVFRIRSVEVIGWERHGAQEIKNSLIYDWKTENTLYFCWKYRTAVSDSAVPYLESIQAKMLSPGKVRLTVKERQLSGYVQYAGENIYFDKDGIVLEVTQEVYEDIPCVSGITMEAPVLYQRLPVENAAQMGAMLKITGLLVKAEFIPDNISFDEDLNITLTVGGITVKLGQNSCLEEKVANLITICQELEGQTGTLNMESFTGKEEIPFQPGEPDSSESEPEEDQESLSGEGDTREDGGNDQEGETGEASGEETGREETVSQEDSTVSGEVTGVAGFMVFDSSGTLRYDARVMNGQVVDASGTPIDGCYVNENGNVVDAYWNEIDPYTGQLAQ